MTELAIRTALSYVKKGAFTRIVYVSEPTLKAAARKEGIVIHKRTEKTVRLGVAYDHIEQVRALEASRTEPKADRAPWCHWEIENMLAKHNTKEDRYISFANVKGGAHVRTRWFLNGVEVPFEEIVASGYILPSYFNGSGEIPAVQKVRIENVISIGGHY